MRNIVKDLRILKLLLLIQSCCIICYEENIQIEYILVCVMLPFVWTQKCLITFVIVGSHNWIRTNGFLLIGFVRRALLLFPCVHLCSLGELETPMLWL